MMMYINRRLLRAIFLMNRPAYPNPTHFLKAHHLSRLYVSSEMQRMTHLTKVHQAPPAMTKIDRKVKTSLLLKPTMAPEHREELRIHRHQALQLQISPPWPQASSLTYATSHCQSNQLQNGQQCNGSLHPRGALEMSYRHLDEPLQAAIGIQNL